MNGVQIAEFITQNISLAVVAIGAIVVGVQKLVKFFKKPNEEKILELRTWLLGVVTDAEAMYGGDTGKVKLAAVYDQFRTVFPSLADKITMDQFKGLVDTALGELQEYKETHTGVQKYLDNGGGLG